MRDIFYHGTNLTRWRLIQREGVLWGVHDTYRYTYLAPDMEWPLAIANSMSGSPVILKVRYKPGTLRDNYGYNPPPGQCCTQFSVFDPIPLKQVTRVILS